MNNKNTNFEKYEEECYGKVLETIIEVSDDLPKKKSEKLINSISEYGYARKLLKTGAKITNKKQKKK